MDARTLIKTYLGGQERVRRYLRGVDEGSELDLEAMDNMEAAVESLRAAGVYDAMAVCAPKLYASAALLFCRQLTDAEDSAQEAIYAQHVRLVLQLRYDPRNIKEDEK